MSRKRCPGKKIVDITAHMSRSEKYYNLLALLIKGAITQEDLQDFSEDLKERIAFVIRDDE